MKLSIQTILPKSLESRFMTLLYQFNLQRLYYLAKYHHVRQFLYRTLNLLFTKPKWWVFRWVIQAKSTHLTLRVQNPLPRKEEYPEGFLPTLNVPFKMNSNLFPPKANSDLLVQFEFHTHRHLINSKFSQSPWLEIEQWIKSYSLKNNPHLFPVWHPYVVSKRIQHWIALWLIKPPEPESQQIVMKSLWEQGMWLSFNLERDIGGNHLWENAHSLFLLGCFLDCSKSKSWLTRGVGLLKQEIENQLLTSGEHFEKSPSYHWELTQGLGLLLPWFKHRRPGDYEWLNHHQMKMASFASQIAHPNGTLPFFNDSWKVQVASDLSPKTNWIGDYFVSKNSNAFFIFDAGNIGPDSLPAHSHCDLLTFELSLNNDILISNSGTFTYQGKERAFYRGTAAHNVLGINGQNTADIWGAFKMGRRGHVIGKGSLSDAHGIWVWGIHDGYSHLGIPEIMRVWFITPNLPFFASFQFLKIDRPQEQITEFIHFSPEVKVSPGDPKSLFPSVVIKHGTNSLARVQTLGSLQSLTIDDSHCSPRFYEQVANKTLKLSPSPMTSKNHFQLATAWAIHSGAEPVKIALDFDHPKIKLDLETDEKPLTTEFTLPRL